LCQVVWLLGHFYVRTWSSLCLFCGCPVLFAFCCASGFRSFLFSLPWIITLRIDHGKSSRGMSEALIRSINGMQFVIK
jgi:hypothetical protein